MYHISYLKEVQVCIAKLVSSVTIKNYVAFPLMCINVYHKKWRLTVNDSILSQHILVVTK